MKFIPPELLRALPHLLIGGGVGAGVTIALVLVEKEPGLIVDTFRAWGPASLIGVVAVVMVSRGFDRMVDTLARGAASQQSLADAVREIAGKDDREREEQRRLISFVGTQMEKILVRMESIDQRLEEKARGAHA